MKTKPHLVVLLLLLIPAVVAVKAQQAAANYQQALSSIASLPNSEEKSEKKGKSLSVFFDERKAEAGEETALAEIRKMLQNLKSTDFYAAYYFLMKIKSINDAKMFLNTDFTAYEQDIIRNKLTKYSSDKIMQKGNPPTYPYGVPLPGSSWHNTTAKMPASTTVQQSSSTSVANIPPATTPKTTVAYQTDDGRAALKKAERAYYLVQYKEAIKWAKLAADKNNAEAMLTLGGWYNNGVAVTKDPIEAVKWYKKAAELGNINAMYQLGSIYADGVYYYKGNISANKTEAIAWLDKAIQAGKNFVPKSYQDDCLECKGSGKIVSQTRTGVSTSKSVSHTNATTISGGYTTVTTNYHPGYTTSTSNCYSCKGTGTSTFTTYVGYGYGEAQRKLADITGQTDLDKATTAYKAKDFSKALKSYKRSAEKGNTQGMYGMGTLYHNGQGVKKDDAMALQWFKKAADAGDKSAQEALKELETKP